MISIKVTIGASATPTTSQDLYASVLIVKPSGTDYIGGPGVTAATGVPLPSSALVIPCSSPRGIALKDTYFVGTQNDTVVCAYEPSA